MKPSDLSKVLIRTKASITVVIDGLERDGMVEREYVGKDHRTKRIKITTKGLDIVEEFQSTGRLFLTPSMPNLSQEEMQQLNTLLRKVRKHLIGQIASLTSET